MTPSPRAGLRTFVTPVVLAVLAVLAGIAAVGQGGCSSRESFASSEASAETELVVFAAASLRDPFEALADELKRAQPGTHVIFNFAGSQELRAQIEQGASADVFASADPRHMRELVSAKRARAPFVFARNELVIAVAAEQVGKLRTVADLAHAARIVIGAPDVPVGRYTAQFLEKAGKSLGADFEAKVNAHVVSRELNVKQALAKVSLGEADAGIVYRSDVTSPQSKASVGVVAIPPELNAVAEYPIAALENAKHPRLAQAWLSLVRSDAGQLALSQAGFLPPEQSIATP